MGGVKDGEFFSILSLSMFCCFEWPEHFVCHVAASSEGR